MIDKPTIKKWAVKGKKVVEDIRESLRKFIPQGLKYMITSEATDAATDSIKELFKSFLGIS